MKTPIATTPTTTGLMFLVRESRSLSNPRKKNPAIIAAIIHISCLAQADSSSPATSRSQGLAQSPWIAIWALWENITNGAMARNGRLVRTVFRPAN